MTVREVTPIEWPFAKDPGEVLDYDLDYADVLVTGETISTSTWTVPAGITKDSDSESDTATKIWVSGGAAGQVYGLANTIVTSSGRTYRRTGMLRVEHR